MNGPLVWAITGERQAAYLFPRDCPRILLWPTPATSARDLETWWGDRTVTMIVHVEWAWLERIRQATLYRYELPAAGFEPLEGGWMQVSRNRVAPVGVETIPDLLTALRDQDVELRVLPSLTPLRGAWQTSLHVSGIRLRNAAGWPA